MIFIVGCRGEALGRISPPGALRTGREAVASSGSHCPAASVERAPVSESARLSSRYAVEPMARTPPAPSQRLQRSIDQNEVDVACQRDYPRNCPNGHLSRFPIYWSSAQCAEAISFACRKSPTTPSRQSIAETSYRGEIGRLDAFRDDALEVRLARLLEDRQPRPIARASPPIYVGR